MPNPELLASFQRCQRYKLARSWEKPWINPARFLRNQYRKYTYSRSSLGKLRLVDTFHCPGFTVVSGEKVSETVASYGIYEDTLTEAFLRLVEPGQVVVDIGMHLGYYTTLFARLVGPEGQVHAFEPTPSTRTIAQRNVEKFRHVTVHPFALWSSVGTATFRDYGVEWMAFNSFTQGKAGPELPPAQEIQVTTTTLDAFRQTLQRPVALLKIDAESAESAILAGAQNFLRQDEPVVSLEVGDVPGQATSQHPIAQLCTLGYRPWEFRDGSFCPHEPRQSYGYDNLIFAPQGRSLK